MGARNLAILEPKQNELVDFYNSKLEKVCKLIDILPWDNKKFYATFMRQVWSYSRESTPLLSLCISEFHKMDIDHKLMIKLKSRFLNHSLEEINHERDAEKDLATLGYELKDIPELSSTKSLWQSQYYYCQSNPIAFFGYILTLEGLAIKRGGHLLEVAGGEFPDAMKFMKLHAEEDENHIESAFKIINEIPEKYHGIIMENLEHSVDCFKQMLLDIEEQSILI